ncbi:methyl-accepting chemotaxis protein [Cytobacillus sp. Hz8]|uniref:methyl-accepting chemotaxis protein n=1 Tax=Cytobacillus sp. Hz8 TaxID=3347168 RepID=UPI0035DAA480
MNFTAIFRNLKTKLIFSFSLVLIIPSLSIGILAFITAKDSVEKEMIFGFEKNITFLNSSIDDTLEKKIHDTTYFANIIQANDLLEKRQFNLKDRLDEYIRLHPEAQSISVGTNKGTYAEMPQKKMEANYDPRERFWYKDAMNQKGKAVVSEPEVSAITGELVITISRAFEDGSGVVAISLPLSYIQKQAQQIKIGKKGYAVILDRNKKYISHPTIKGGTVPKEDFYNKLYAHDKGKFSYTYHEKEKLLSYTTNELTGWKLGGTVEKTEIKQSAYPILKTTIIIIVSAIMLGAAVIYLIIKSIIKPIKEIKEKAITVSKGDLTEHIEVKSKDEIGQLAYAFNEMQHSLKGLVQEVEQSAEQVASSAEELSASAEQTNAATEQVAASIQEVANSAEKQTSSVEKSAQTLGEVSNGVIEIAESSMMISKLANNTTTQAEEGEKAVANTVHQMNSIQKSVQESNRMIYSLYERSKEVNSILDVITQIADQTNLLALNAAIEAARAGEQGKGFAVVADEVRKLAEQSQHSAKEIHMILQGILQDTENSVQIMGHVNEAVEEGVIVSNKAIEKFSLISQSAKEVPIQMQEVSNHSKQISAAVQEITLTANEIAELAQGNASTSEEVAASAEEQLAAMEEISASSQSLSSRAEELRGLIAKFKY